MAERFTSDLLFILVVLIVAALLGFIIGYLLRKGKYRRYLILEEENEQLKAKLDACLHQKEKEKVTVPFDAVAAQTAFGSKIWENDLKIVEGIGEKIEMILKNRGIATWQKLSETPENEIMKILLADGGPSYRIHEPRTWPTQALMASHGKWTQLKEYQDQLIRGR